MDTGFAHFLQPHPLGFRFPDHYPLLLRVFPRPFPFLPFFVPNLPSIRPHVSFLRNLFLRQYHPFPFPVKFPQVLLLSLVPDLRAPLHFLPRFL